MIELRPYQQEAVQQVISEWDAGHLHTLLVLPTGCHDPDQLVLCCNGSLIKASDVKPGDYLMGPDGEAREVYRVVKGTAPMYKVIPVKGEPFIVTGDHILPLVQTCTSSNPQYPSEDNDGIVDLVTVSSWKDKSKTFKHIHKLYRSECVEFIHEYEKEIPLDPYFLGVLLGDGSFKYCSVSVTTPHEAIRDAVYEQADLFGCHIRTVPAGKATQYYLSKNRYSGKYGGLQCILKHLGVFGKDAYTKFVPDIYKTGSVECRKAVLAGLLDTDGYLRCNEYDYVSASKQLADDVAFIARSLGLAAYVSEAVKKCQNDFIGTYWRVSISGDCSIIPCRVKKSGERKQKKNVLRTGIKEIQYVGEGPYCGFNVSGDHLYLMGDFTVTHNCGKTICFAKITEEEVRKGNRVLILAHRAELLDQAADKLHRSVHLKAAKEKAEESALGSWYRVTIGSVQSLCRPKRLEKFEPDYYDTIIIDEAHHALSSSYQTILEYFKDARVLGVTATPERGDHKNLGEFFESIAYEYSLPQAIKEGYLCKIKAQTVPLRLDISGVAMQNGDYAAGALGSALDPYLDQIAEEMRTYCKGRKTVVFLPLVATSQKFVSILNSKGISAAEVNGESVDRQEKLQAFDRGDFDVLCNSMLLTEGWDCPSVDCIVVLRPTKVRGLYCLDEQTEVLTPDGWKKDVEVGELVAAFDKDTGKINYVPAIAKVRRMLEPDEFFCSIEGQSTSIRVTNKHRMLYDNKRRNGWKIKTAEEIADMKDGAFIPVAGQGNFPGVPLTDDELRFIGWVMTDGTINKHNNAIAITQAKHQPWLEKIQECIDGCNLKYRRFERSGISQFNQTSPSVVWTISKGEPRATHKDRRGWGYLEPYLSKDLSPELFNMTEKQFDVMLEAIHLGDGQKQKSDKWVQHSYHIAKGNKTFIERLQMMAVQRGYRANVTVEYHENRQPLWTIHLKKQNFVKVGSQSGVHAVWKKEPHTDEWCWCVENRLGTLVTRHNGKVAIVGNCQMIGRGTRLSPGKEDLLILDFLWQTERIDLCRPACLICKDELVAKKMTEALEESGEAIDLEEAEAQGERDAIAEREQKLAEQLRAMRRRKAQLVDPLQYAISVQNAEIVGWQPDIGDKPISDKQIEKLEKMGIFAGELKSAMEADLILKSLMDRRSMGLATPKQIRFLEQRGFRHVGTWEFDAANKMISRISLNNWKIPYDVNPATYEPAKGGWNG